MITQVKRSLVVFFLAISLLIPCIVRDPYYQHIVNVSFLFAISVYAFNIITGFTGQLNIAHAGFMGIGAYTSAIAVTKFSLSFWIAMPFAGLVTGICGFLVGFPALRVRGVYFSLTMLAVGEILYHVFDNWTSVTGGSMGIAGIPAPTPISLPKGILITFDNKTGFYYLCLAILLLSVYVNRELLNSRSGRSMLAIREDEDLSQSVGISIAKTKIFAFILSSILCGISGSLFAHYFRVVSPNSFTLAETFRLCTMLIVGGMGTLFGPLVGALLFSALPEFLRAIDIYQWMAYGVILMVCVIFLPDGIVGFINNWIRSRH